MANQTSLWYFDFSFKCVMYMGFACLCCLAIRQNNSAICFFMGGWDEAWSSERLDCCLLVLARQASSLSTHFFILPYFLVHCNGHINNHYASATFVLIIFPATYQRPRSVKCTINVLVMIYPYIKWPLCMQFLHHNTRWTQYKLCTWCLLHFMI